MTVTVTVIDGNGQFAFFNAPSLVGTTGDTATAEDRFFGVESADGIQQITILSSGPGIQIDHIQYAAPVAGTLYNRNLMNGDAKADLVWHSPTVSNLGIWFMDGLVRIGGGAPSQSPSPNWAPQGLGDLDGINGADIVWRDSTTNLFYIWLMNGQTVSSSSAIVGAGAVPSTYTVLAVADVSGDKKADIIFKNTTNNTVVVWLMNGATKTSGGTLPGLSIAGVSYVGAGDINGDGRYDLIWRNTSTGVVAGTLMNGLTPIATQNVGNASGVASNWACQAVGDLDGDGRADLVWRNLSTGDVNGWLLNGNYRKAGGQMGTIPLAWTLRASADMSGDGKADLVWTNSQTLQVNGWIMNGLVKVSGGTIQNIPAGWNLLNR